MRRRARAEAGALVLLGLLMSGCGDEEPRPSAEQRPPASRVESASPLPARSPSASAVRAPTTPAAVANALTGYGAARESWNRAHQEAPGFTPGSAYLPLVRGDQPRYAGVSGDDQVLSYIYYFESGTSLEAAMRQVLATEFPKGAKYGRVDRQEPHCLLAEVRSAPVEASMASEGTQYRPLVGFFSEPSPDDPEAPLNTAAIDSATLTIVEAGTEGDVGMC